MHFWAIILRISIVFIVILLFIIIETKQMVLFLTGINGFMQITTAVAIAEVTFLLIKSH